MVDTINPNTNQPDSFVSNQNEGGETPTAGVPETRFYGGFDKPEETKINLADSQPFSGEPQVATAVAAPAPEPRVQSTPQPVADVAPVSPTEVKHTTYVNTADIINWRGVLTIAVIGLVATAIVGTIIYFVTSSVGNGKVDEQQAKLDTIQRELAALKETPSPLELPAATTPTANVTVTPTVSTPTVTPTPVETQQTTTPTGDGSKQAAG